METEQQTIQEDRQEVEQINNNQSSSSTVVESEPDNLPTQTTSWLYTVYINPSSTDSSDSENIESNTSEGPFIHSTDSD